MFDYVKADLDHLCLGRTSLAARLGALLASDGFLPLAVYRFGRWVQSAPGGRLLLPLRCVLWLAYLCASHATVRLFGIRIDHRASVGKRFVIYHFGGVEIGPCQIGENCSIHQCVRIGEWGAADEVFAPQIGSNVWIGPHAVIKRSVRVSDNATVAAGAVVTRDVGEGCLVAGNPARVVAFCYDNRVLLGEKGESAEAPNPGQAGTRRAATAGETI